MNPPPNPNAPAPAAAPPTVEGTAGDIAARLRAHAGLPPLPKGGQPDPKAPPAPNAGATAAGTPGAPTTAPSDPKPTDEPKAEQSPGALALALVREQKARQVAEAKNAELLAKVNAGETTAAPMTAAKEKWAAGKFAEAIRDAFGVKNFSDDFLVQLASAEPEAEHLSPEQLKEQIRQQVRDEFKADADAQAAQLADLRGAAVEEVGQVLGKSPEKWPTVWKFGVTGERLAQLLDASYDSRTGRSATPEKIFDDLEKEYRGEVEQLPYWQRQADPATPAEPPPPAAPRSFGAESRRGPVPTTEPAKPQTAEERWEARRKAEAEWKARVFAARA